MGSHVTLWLTQADAVRKRELVAIILTLHPDLVQIVVRAEVVEHQFRLLRSAVIERGYGHCSGLELHAAIGVEMHDAAAARGAFMLSDLVFTRLHQRAINIHRIWKVHGNSVIHWSLGKCHRASKKAQGQS